MTNVKQIGFIGLGIMGKPMVRNLLKAGYAVTVHDSREDASNELAADSAVPAGSPCEVARRSELVITMLPDSPQVSQVVAGKDGILEGAQKEATVMDMSTIAPATARELADLCRPKGVDFLDAPVSGGESGAIAATLSIMVGGKAEAFDKCLPILRTLGKNVVHMGASGAGQSAKLCNQVIASLNLLAMSEGLMLATKSGLEMEKLLSVVSAGAAGSWMLSNLGPKILQGDLEPGFKVRLLQKDLRLALAAAEDLKLPLPGAALVHQLYRSVEAAGKGEKGMQALVTAIETLSGSSLTGTRSA